MEKEVRTEILESFSLSWDLDAMEIREFIRRLQKHANDPDFHYVEIRVLALEHEGPSELLVVGHREETDEEYHDRVKSDKKKNTLSEQVREVVNTYGVDNVYTILQRIEEERDIDGT